jgi:hypothetical protein
VKGKYNLWGWKGAFLAAREGEFARIEEPGEAENSTELSSDIVELEYKFIVSITRVSRFRRKNKAEWPREAAGS